VAVGRPIMRSFCGELRVDAKRNSITRKDWLRAGSPLALRSMRLSRHAMHVELLREVPDAAGGRVYPAPNPGVDIHAQLFAAYTALIPNIARTRGSVARGGA
jgi:hypothetical protein